MKETKDSLRDDKLYLLTALKIIDCNFTNGKTIEDTRDFIKKTLTKFGSTIEQKPPKGSDLRE